VSDFTRVWPNKYESCQGYSVEIVVTNFPAVALRYRDGARVMDVWAEAMAAPGGFVIDPDSARRWSPPHDTESVGCAEQERVLQRVEAAMAYAGFPTDRYPSR
jgi:hypothetical protein